MSNYSELCVEDSNLLGTGVGNCPKLLGPDVMFILSEDTLTGTAAELKTKAFWDAKIKSKEAFIFPLVREVEPQNVEATYFEAGDGSSYLIKDEVRKTMYQFIENIVTHSGMKSYANRGWNIWYYTEQGYLRCHTKGVDSYEGLKASRFYVNAQTTQTFTDALHTPVIIEQADVNDWDMEYGVIQPDFDMKDLEGVFQADVVEVSSTQVTGTLTVNIKVSVKGTNTPLAGLLPADFNLIDESGATVTVDTAVESPSGTYAIVATDDATTGTIGLKDVVTIGTDNYQSVLIPFAV